MCSLRVNVPLRAEVATPKKQIAPFKRTVKVDLDDRHTIGYISSTDIKCPYKVEKWIKALLKRSQLTSLPQLFKRWMKLSTEYTNGLTPNTEYRVYSK